MINIPNGTVPAPKILSTTILQQFTPQDQSMRAFIGETWDDNLTPHDNLVSTLKHSTNVAEKGTLVLKGLEFHLEPGEQLEIPKNIGLVNCRLLSGTIKYHTGKLIATSDQASALLVSVPTLNDQPVDALLKVNSYLSAQDSRSFGQVNKNILNTVISPSTLNLARFRFVLTPDCVGFDTADQLIRLGVCKLPDFRKTEQSFDSKSELFRHLSHSCEDLYLYLRTKPESLNDQDEDGMTLLHHAASTGVTMGGNRSSLIHYLLFNAQGLDFNIKDSSGDTPIHRAGHYCTDKTTCFYVFPDYVRKAAELGFDFRTRGHKRYTILHLSALTYYLCGYRGRITNVSTVLHILNDYHIPNLKSVLDTMSDSGATVLFYCINQFMFDEARELLQAGADPQLCGSPERNPVAQIDTYKEEMIAYRAELVSDNNQQQIAHLDDRFLLLVEFEGFLKSFIKPAVKSD